MFWLILVVIVLVVGAAALVALGGGGSLPEAERDRLSARLPLDRPLNRADVDGLRFPMGLRGYRMDEVDDVLDRLGAELSHRDVRIAELETALAAALDAPQDERTAPASAPAAPSPSGPAAPPQEPQSGPEQA
ncbi:DivIVA domain-containing protein [Streptacidiphilus sp. PB12-B1b]|uniref:DivIVA domain-containing protein n=1 Tax=Streptacidiphilus sp. PB12-B1b TaxID=2705012 RepID=UPI001CDB5A86|nr:DivIVA domain-containing protein [Streptacidiphilus sp. PB12-B1b]